MRASGTLYSETGHQIQESDHGGTPFGCCFASISSWYIVHCDRSLAQNIGVSKTSCCEICADVYSKICKHLQPVFIKMPTGDALVNNLKFFHSIKGFPICLGAIDGSHIPIMAPSVRHADYINRKGYHSIVLQGTVDFFGKFIDINVGWPGRAHDARVFKNSSLYMRMTTAPGLYPDVPAYALNGIKIRPYLLGDAAYK